MYKSIIQYLNFCKVGIKYLKSVKCVPHHSQKYATCDCAIHALTRRI